MQERHEPILVIDDDQSIIDITSTMLSTFGFKNVVTTKKGKEGLNLFKKLECPLVIIDLSLPDISGMELLDRIKEIYPPSQAIIITGYIDNDLIIESLRKGACDFIAKPITLEILKHSVEQCLEKYDLVKENNEYQYRLENMIRERTENLTTTNKKLDNLFYRTVEALSRTMEVRDPYTAGHQKRVATLAVKIAKNYGLDNEHLKTIKLAAMLHDIGKFYVPQELLVKPTKLNAIEYNLIKKHPLEGYNIINDIPFEDNIANIVLQHHERLDGSGYPNGIKEDDICLEAKIIAVADVAEAMISHRPYRPALGIDITIKELNQNKYKKYDEKVVDSCIKVFKEHEYDTDKIFK